MVSPQYVQSETHKSQQHKDYGFIGIVILRKSKEWKPAPPFQGLFSDVQPFQQVLTGVYPAIQNALSKYCPTNPCLEHA
jgi:hypothetical protein